MADEKEAIVAGLRLRPGGAGRNDLAAPGAQQPNILWIYVEDQNPWYGTYGESLVETPNIDALAREGVVFERALDSAHP